MHLMTRRTALQQGGAMTAALFGSWFSRFGATALAGQSGQSKPFRADDVRLMAKALAAMAYAPGPADLPAPFDKLTYDQYRDIRFRQDKAIWRGQAVNHELQLFQMGWLYNIPVEIFVVEDGQSRPLRADSDLFNFGPLLGNKPISQSIGFSGFRIHAPINRPEYLDEFVVFQGASYFRAVARGQAYGLSARGLAIDTAQPGGEEFPSFRTFWIERPAIDAQDIVVHALLDSPSVTGSYRFVIAYGLRTVMDVDVHLFPRRDLQHVGIAPLTSMYLFGHSNRLAKRDFRPAVHDSEALAIHNGNGERLWRPLANPKRLQVSAFMDKDPKGFGLIQRDRLFTAYEDLEAHYEKRPSLWVEPRGNWGQGRVELVELPIVTEGHDNIVAFWRPSQAIKKGTEHDLSYRLLWTNDIEPAWPRARVAKTRTGDGKKPGTVLFVVDFSGAALADTALPDVQLNATAGKLSKPSVQKNSHANGVRVAFTLTPRKAELSELRLSLLKDGKSISEVWLYRWTNS